MTISRRPLLFGGVAYLIAASTALAESTGSVRIGILLNSIPVEGLAWLAKGLRDAGYEEGRNLKLLVRSSEGREERLASLAAELVDARVDLIVAPLNPEIRAALQATSTIPIVMVYSVAPVETGLVASLSRPGANVTGTATNGPEVAGKMVEVLHDAILGLRRLSVLYDPTFPGMGLYARAGEAAAAALGIRWNRVVATTGEDLQRALTTLQKDRPDGVFVAMTGVFIAEMRRVVNALAGLRLPTLYSTRAPVALGGTMSYAPDFVALGVRTVAIIDKLLQGAKPADTPVEQPSRYQLTINMKAARAIGLEVPRALQMRADELLD